MAGTRRSEDSFWVEVLSFHSETRKERQTPNVVIDEAKSDLTRQVRYLGGGVQNFIDNPINELRTKARGTRTGCVGQSENLLT